MRFLVNFEAAGRPIVDVHRKVILIVGPLLLIFACYLLSSGNGSDSRRSADQTPSAAMVESTRKADANSPLQRECEFAANELLTQLDPSYSLLVRPPYVIAGNLSDEMLERLHRDVIHPTEQALSVSFFDQRPTAPIKIVVFATESDLRDFARRVDRRQPDSYYGYYLRSQRRIVVNISTGAGTLAHELTHALSHFDFPNMPEWFDEGLASLFEQSDFSDNSRRLAGADNWRVHHVLRALHDNRLRPTAELLSDRGLRSEHQTIDYAHARYICLYLQEQQLLEPYYRKLRARAEHDPHGLNTLLELLSLDTSSDLDTDFRRWVVKYHKAQRQKTVRRDRSTLSMMPASEFAKEPAVGTLDRVGLRGSR